MSNTNGITYNTEFNIYYSNENISKDVTISQASPGIIVCKDDQTYNLLFVDDKSCTHLLADVTENFNAIAPLNAQKVDSGRNLRLTFSYNNSNGFLSLSNNALAFNYNKLSNI